MDPIRIPIDASSEQSRRAARDYLLTLRAAGRREGPVNVVQWTAPDGVVIATWDGARLRVDQAVWDRMFKGL